jgi:hypothetical protein
MAKAFGRALIAAPSVVSVMGSAFRLTCVQIRHIGLRESPDSEEHSEGLALRLPIAVGTGG